MNSNLSKVLTLLNLLQNRDFVTLRQINDICGIPNRTFYRYLKDLSESNIPIYNDPEVRGYRLTQKKLSIFFSPQELSLLTLSLQQFSAMLNQHYKEDIDSLMKKLYALATFPIEENLPQSEFSYNNEKEKEAISSHLLNNLLSIAVENEFSLRLLVKNGKSEKAVEIAAPTIVFDKKWFIHNKIDGDKIPFENIKHIQIF